MPTWTGVSKLSVVLEGGRQSSDIHANGRHRIAVTVGVQPTDAHGNPVDVAAEHLADRLWLVDYATESTLNWHGHSDWSYTDEANQFTAAPGDFGAVGEESTDDSGTPQVTFYVYCAPGAHPKSIGVRVKTDSGDTHTSSRDGTWDSSVTLTPKAPVAYTRNDIDWQYSRTSTQNGENTKYVTTDAWNYYLSLKSEDNYFVTFAVSAFFDDSGYDGFFASNIPPDDNHKNFYGGYVWYYEPHDSAYYSGEDGASWGQIANFPEGNRWWDFARIYDREHPERHLCFSWVHAVTGGSGWHIPNGPLNTWKEGFRTKVVAYDRYGNTGTYWVDGSDITQELKIYDHEL